jgi:hypothetical protein
MKQYRDVRHIHSCRITYCIVDAVKSKFIIRLNARNYYKYSYLLTQVARKFMLKELLPSVLKWLHISLAKKDTYYMKVNRRRNQFFLMSLTVILIPTEFEREGNVQGIEPR